MTFIDLFWYWIMAKLQPTQTVSVTAAMWKINFDLVHVRKFPWLILYKMSAYCTNQVLYITHGKGVGGLRKTEEPGKGRAREKVTRMTQINTWKGGGGTEKDRGTREGEGKRESDKNDSRAMGWAGTECGIVCSHLTIPGWKPAAQGHLYVLCRLKYRAAFSLDKDQTDDTFSAISVKLVCSR